MEGRSLRLESIRRKKEKIDVILDVFEDGEKLQPMEIANRLEERGVEVHLNSLRRWIHFNMVHQYLGRERRPRETVFYRL